MVVDVCMRGVPHLLHSRRRAKLLFSHVSQIQSPGINEVLPPLPPCMGLTPVGMPNCWFVVGPAKRPPRGGMP